MSISIKYFLTDQRGNLIDWYNRFGLPFFDVVGKQAVVFGSAGDDAVYVQAWTSADLTQLGTGADKVYLSGNLADYSHTIDQDSGIYTFTRTGGVAGLTEVVKLVVSDENDMLFFADGHVSLNAATNSELFNGIGFQPIASVSGGGTPLAPPEFEEVTNSTAVTKVFIVDSGGVLVPMAPQAGQALKVFGGAGQDVVHVRAGTRVDATELGTGNDHVYLSGNLADYTQHIDQDTGIYTFSRLIHGVTEEVKVTLLDENDVLHFADGQVVFNVMAMNPGEANNQEFFVTISFTNSNGDTSNTDTQVSISQSIVNGLSVSGVDSTDPGLGGLFVGNSLVLSVTLSSAVNVDTSLGLPRLVLQMGDQLVWAQYDSALTRHGGQNVQTLKFRYVVQAGDEGLVSLEPNALDLNGALVVLDGQNVLPDFLQTPALGAAQAVLVDTSITAQRMALMSVPQLLALTRAQGEAMAAVGGFDALSDLQLTSLPAPLIDLVPAPRWADVSPVVLAGLSVGQLTAFTSNQAAVLVGAHLVSLGTKVGAFSPAATAALDFSDLLPAQLLDVLSVLQTTLNPLTGRPGLTHLSTVQAQSLVAGQLSDIPVPLFAGLPARFVQGLNGSVLSSLTELQVEALTGSQLQALLSAGRLGALPFDLSQAQLSEGGVVGLGLTRLANSPLTDAAEVDLLNDHLALRAVLLPSSPLNTLAQLEAVANVVDRVMKAVAGVQFAPALTPADFAVLGIQGVDAVNLPGVLSALASQEDTGQSVSSLSSIQAMVLQQAPVVTSFVVSDTRAPTDAGKGGDAVVLQLSFSRTVDIAAGTVVEVSFNGHTLLASSAAGAVGVSQAFFVVNLPNAGNGSAISLLRAPVSGSITAHGGQQPLSFAAPLEQAGGYTVDNSAPVLLLTNLNVAENTTAVATLATNDPGALFNTVLSGADASRFTLSESGVLAFKSPKNWQFLDDAGADGTYQIFVTVSDVHGNHRTQALSVNLIQGNDPATGPVVLQGLAQEGVTLTVVTSGVYDPDGTVLAFEYQWQYAYAVDGPYVDVVGANGTSYVIASDRSDLDKFIRVVVTATNDGVVGGTRLFSVPSDAVVDIVPPDAVDFSSEPGAQSAATVSLNVSELRFGKFLFAEVMAPAAADIAEVHLVLGGAWQTLAGVDQLVLDTARSLHANFSAHNVSLGGVSGLSYQYTASTQTLVISRHNGGALVPSTLDEVLEVIRFRSISASSAERTVSVKYVDAYDNAGTAGVLTVQADARLGLALMADTGLDAGDGVTSDNRLSVTGLLSGAGWEYRTSNSGAWVNGVGTSFTLPSATYAAGQVQVRHRDARGLYSAETLMGAFTIDQDLPAVPSVRFVSDTGMSDADGFTQLGELRVEQLEEGASWMYSVNAGVTWQTGTGSGWVLAAGDYAAGTVQVRQTDRAGNSSLAWTHDQAWRVDNVAPVVLSFTVDTQWLRAGDSAVVRLVFSEAVPQLSVDDLVVVGATLSDWATTDGGVTWTGVLRPLPMTLLYDVTLTLPAVYEDRSGRVGVTGVASTPFSIDSVALDPQRGWTVTGAQVGDRSGASVAWVGNALADDGLDGFLIGGAGLAQDGSVMSGGAVYALYGTTATTPLDGSALEAWQGWSWPAQSAADAWGAQLVGLGDVNADGRLDLAVAAPLADAGAGAGAGAGADAGRVHVMLEATADALLPNGGLAGLGGWLLEGTGQGDSLGWSMSSAGDVNGDGVDDVLLGSPWADGGAQDGGSVLLVYGGIDGSVGMGRAWNGSDADSWLGYSVAGGGDFNGDGLDDVVFAAPHASVSASGDSLQGAGLVYVVYGSQSGLASLADVRSGVGGCLIQGFAPGQALGTTMTMVGDVNGDGFDDLLVGAPDHASSRGGVWLVWGGANTSVLDLANPGAQAVYLFNGQDDEARLGSALAGAGDFNADGYADVLLAAPGTHGPAGENAGAAYLVFGKASGEWGAALDVTQMSWGAGTGLTFHGLAAGDGALGMSLAGGGDVNGDGLDDLLIGFAAAAETRGVTQVLLGDAVYLSQPRITGSAGDDVLGAADAGAHIILGLAGNDVLFGAGGDVLLGGEGDDVLVLDSSWMAAVSEMGHADLLARLDGGNGFDAVSLNGDGVRWDLTTVPGLQKRLQNVEMFDLSHDLSAQSVRLGILEVLDLGQVNLLNDGLLSSGTGLGDVVQRHQLWFKGTADDVLVLSDAEDWIAQADVVDQGEVIRVFNHASSAAQILLSGDMRMLSDALKWTLKGEQTGGYAGAAAITGVDWDGDGFDDVLLSAPLASGGAGAVYFVSGAASLQDAVLLPDQVVFTGDPLTPDNLGFAMELLGDVNGDGALDYALVSASANNTAGRVDVVFGGGSGWPDLSSIASGSGGFSLHGVTPEDGWRTQLVALGDLDANGYDDFVLSVPSHDQWLDASGLALNHDAGRVYVFWGQDSPRSSMTLDLSAMNVDVLTGDSSGDELGASLSGGQDFDGDGVNDWVMSAPGADLGNGVDDAGVVYVVNGAGSLASSPGATMADRVLADGGWVIEGLNAYDRLGVSLDLVGDVNGDGKADLLLGASDAGSGEGRAWLVFGQSGGGLIDLSGPGVVAFTGSWFDSYDAMGLGSDVAGVGDFNGDGLSDFLISARGVSNDDPAFAGRAWLVLGQETWDATLNLDGLNMRDDTGMVLNGQNADDGAAGVLVKAGGDVNGDGFDDLMVSRPNAWDAAGELQWIMGYSAVI